MRVRLYSGIDLAEWRSAAQRGERPGLAPYGLEHLTSAGVTLVPRRLPPWLAAGPGPRIVEAVEWRTMPLVGPLGLVRGREELALAILEREGITHALLAGAGIAPWARVPLVLVSCWMADEVRGASPRRLSFLRRLAQGASLIVYWSTNQREVFERDLGVPGERLFFVPFGIETEFYAPLDVPRSDFVLSVGQDRGRDWGTLVAAVNALNVPVKLVCPQAAVQGLDLAPHVELLGEVDHVRLRQLLARARALALASDPSVVYPTGQTVLLNAMAMGTPTVVTDTLPLRDYLRHGENTWVAPARDPAALTAGIRAVLSDPAVAQRISAGAMRDVQERFNARAMWAAVAERMRTLVAAPRGSRTPGQAV